MEVTKEHKDQVETKIVEAILAALDTDEISSEQLPEISGYVLDTIDTVTTQDQLMQFLRDLSSKWSIFTKLLVLESGEVKEKTEDKVAEDVLKMAKEGKIDEAIGLAKTMTENPAQEAVQA